MPNEKEERNQVIVKMRKNNPKMTLEEIGEMYNISAPRVYYILKRSGVKKEATE